jgi:hypothetical protein
MWRNLQAHGPNTVPPALQAVPAPFSPADSAPRSSTSSVRRPVSALVRRPMPRWLAFLNTTKYPASFLFLVMTLGPFFLAVALLEENHSRLGEILNVFGRVPLFYYVLHIPLIHFAAILVSLVRTGAVTGWLFTNHPVGNPQPPEGYTWSLGSSIWCSSAYWYRCTSSVIGSRS